VRLSSWVASTVHVMAVAADTPRPRDNSPQFDFRPLYYRHYVLIAGCHGAAPDRVRRERALYGRSRAFGGRTCSASYAVVTTTIRPRFDERSSHVRRAFDCLSEFTVT